jgi:hypothetical protein
MVSHVSHSVHVPPKEHIYTKGGARIVGGQSRIVGDGLTHVSHSVRYLRNKWAVGQDVEAVKSGLATVAPFNRCMYLPRNTFYTKGGPG